MREEPSSDEEEAKGAFGGREPSDGIGDGLTGFTWFFIVFFTRLTLSPQGDADDVDGDELVLRLVT